MRVTVHTHLEVPLIDLDHAKLVEIQERLTIPNTAYEKMKKEQVWGWQLEPKTFSLWNIQGDKLVLPRGFANQLRKILGNVDWADRRVYVPVDTSGWKVPSPKGPHQAKAMKSIVYSEQGVCQMPPGSGKTVAILEAIRRAEQRALVIVDKTNIAAQWVDRCEQFLGFTPGIVGDGYWDDDGDMVIALQQTLWSRKNDLGDWWEKFGFVCLDECHHASASTYYDILQRFPALWRIGVSATPHKSPELEPLINAALGEVFLDAPSDQAEDIAIRVVDTAFGFSFWPTHNPMNGKCKFGQCSRKGRVHRNNYSEMMSALSKDDRRNGLIAANARTAYASGRCVLIVSKRLGHLKAIREKFKNEIPDERVFMLTGEQNTERRMEVIAEAELGSCIILSTIADEALDIPRLDSLHLAWPTRNTEIVRQQCGRLQRPHPDKQKPEIVDYSDRVRVLHSQLQGRMAMYRAQGWDIES